MGIWELLSTNWFALVQTAGIIASLLFTSHTIRADGNARQIETLITFTEHHRQIWSLAFEVPEIANHYFGESEARKRLLVTLLIHHLHALFRAIQKGLIPEPAKMRQDIKAFFTDEFSKTIWTESAQYHEPDFVNFIDLIVD